MNILLDTCVWGGARVNLAARRQGPFCARVLTTHGEVLAAGAIVTVDPKRVRVRLATDGDNGQ